MMNIKAKTLFITATYLFLTLVKANHLCVKNGSNKSDAYFDRGIDFTRYFTYREGTLPIIISITHGGTIEFEEFDFYNDRGYESHVIDIGNEIDGLFMENTGKRPYIVFNKIHPNRYKMNVSHNPPNSPAYEDPDVAPVYDFHRDILQQYRVQIREQWNGVGLMLELHGFSIGNPENLVIRGTRNKRSIEKMLMTFGDDALVGPKSFFGVLDAAGIDVEPDINDPNAPETRYTGGNLTKVSGSDQPTGIDTYQIEISRDLRNDINQIAFDVYTGLLSHFTAYIDTISADGFEG